MSPEEQRIKIAEACGWERRKPDNLYPEVRWLDPQNKTKWRADYAVKATGLPDYLNDLNAMHEAEKVLTPDQFPEYLRQLQAITQSEHCFEVENRFNLVTATAPQRAEAFLRTLGLWKDE